MSDVAMNQKLAIAATITDGIAIGAKNIGSILVNILLWVLTAWIPYLNVGTTIGLIVGIVTKASRGEIISPTEIFNPEYRKYMGEFFLTSGLVGVGLTIATAFLVIPGIVLGIAWSLAILLAVDKGKNPSEAVSLSNKYTYGNKGRIFGIYLVFILVFGMAIGILIQIPGIGIVLAIVAFLFSLFVNIGIQASIYRQLTENAILDGGTVQKEEAWTPSNIPVFPPFSVKTVVAIGIGAALMFVLMRFVTVPTGVPNVNVNLGIAVLALFAAVFGPVAGFLIGFIGHTLVDLTWGWGVWWTWVVCSALFGFSVGLFRKLYPIEEGYFGVKQIVMFNIVQAITNIVVWIGIAPTLDVLINQRPASLVYTQGVTVAAINIASVLILGTLLAVGYSKRKTRAGSLKAE